MQWIRAEGVRLPIAKKVGWVSKVAELVNRNGFPTHPSASLPLLSMAFICAFNSVLPGNNISKTPTKSGVLRRGGDVPSQDIRLPKADS